MVQAGIGTAPPSDAYIGGEPLTGSSGRGESPSALHPSADFARPGSWGLAQLPGLKTPGPSAQGSLKQDGEKAAPHAPSAGERAPTTGGHPEIEDEWDMPSIAFPATPTEGAAGQSQFSVRALPRDGRAAGEQPGTGQPGAEAISKTCSLASPQVHGFPST